MPVELPIGQKMWVAYEDDVEVVHVVAKGAGQRVLKNRIKHPYVVRDEHDEEFVIGIDDLCDSPRCARLKQLEIRAKYGLDDAEEDDEEEFDDEDLDEDDE